MAEAPTPTLHTQLEDLRKDRRARADRLVDQAKLQALTDGGLATSDLLRSALTIDPEHHEAQILLDTLHQMFVPRWHFSMLGDTGRNSAYAKAIAAKVRPGDIVLDIGCGAGLTAMLAARAGAEHVYTCESQPMIAAAAKRVIAENGLSDRITVLPKMSHNLVVGEDMAEPADVVLSEIVDTVLLGEGAIATLFHAMHQLAKPGARTIPETGRLFAQPVESQRLFEIWRPAKAEGFDLSPFHGFATMAQMTPHDFAACALRSLGRPTELFSFDFRAPSLASASVSKNLICAQRGTLHAVLVFFEMELAPGVSLGNGLTADGHWGRTAFLQRAPGPVDPDTQVKVTAAHDTTQLSLSVQSIKAPDVSRHVQPTKKVASQF